MKNIYVVDIEWIHQKLAITIFDDVRLAENKVCGFLNSYIICPNWEQPYIIRENQNEISA